MRLYTQRQKEKGIAAGVAALCIVAFIAVLLMTYAPKVARVAVALGLVPR